MCDSTICKSEKKKEREKAGKLLVLFSDLIKSVLGAPVVLTHCHLNTAGSPASCCCWQLLIKPE